ncbi:MAG: PAS domain S-box protein, partial [Candidatus Hydrogenedentota bacterium]
RMFQHVDDVYFEVTPEGRILDMSPSIQRATGFSRKDVVGKTADDFYLDDEQRRELRRRIRETGRVEDFDMRLRLSNGREGDFSISATLVAGVPDAPPRVVGALRNISKRKDAERTLAYRASLNERMRQLAKALDESRSLDVGLSLALQTAMELAGWQGGAVYVLQEGRPALRVRQNLPYATAISLEKLPVEEGDMPGALSSGRPITIGSLAWDFLAMPELRDYQGAHVVPCLSGEEAAGYLVLAVPEGKDSHPPLTTETAIASETGAFIARRLFIEKMERRKQQYERAQEFAHVGSWEYDVVANRFRGARETARIFGFAEDVEGPLLENVIDIIHPNDRDRIMTSFREFLEGKVEAYDVEYRVIRPTDKASRTVHSVAQAVENDAGRITKVMGTVQDITEEKQLQQQLMLAQRMESVGLLAGGIAHDFNNILSVILSYSDLTLRDMDTDDPKYPMIHEIGEAAERARHLTQQLLAFSRRQVMEMRVIDLNAVLRNMAPMFERLIGEDIELHLDLDDDLHSVQADVAQIQQIMMNLVVNARDAMTEGGAVTIATTCATVSAPEPGQPIRYPAPGEYSLISVSDTGAGISPSVLEHVFDPFFTTKAPGEGTGLGLATVYGIVKQHGGHIWAESTPGEGSCFQVYLPAVDKAPEQLEEPKASENNACGTETILVVEDEDMVRNLTSSVLQRHGYRVLTAEDGQAALEVVENSDWPIDLLLTDVVMPRMNGRDLYKTLASRQPDLKVLFMSGYLNELVANCSSLGPETALLQKPFTVQTLTEKVRSVLDA